MYKIIASGSKGNAILYFGCILVDCGVPYKSLEPYLEYIKLILLTHEHGDHINRATLKEMLFNYPKIKIGVPIHLEQIIINIGIKRFRYDIIELLNKGETYNYGLFEIAPIQLYHDVPNFGYRIFKDGKKIFHATDTMHLDNISAKGYDLYAIEGNYCQEKANILINEKEAKGEYAYQKGSINSHLSIQQAQEFYIKNKKDSSQIVYLHQSENSL